MATVSEAAVLAAVDDGVITVPRIALATGAAAWWVRANVDELVRRGVLVERGGRLWRAPR